MLQRVCREGEKGEGSKDKSGGGRGGEGRRVVNYSGKERNRKEWQGGERAWSWIVGAANRDNKRIC